MESNIVFGVLEDVILGKLISKFSVITKIPDWFMEIDCSSLKFMQKYKRSSHHKP